MHCGTWGSVGTHDACPPQPGPALAPASLHPAPPHSCPHAPPWPRPWLAPLAPPLPGPAPPWPPPWPRPGSCGRAHFPWSVRCGVSARALRPRHHDIEASVLPLTRSRQATALFVRQLSALTEPCIIYWAFCVSSCTRRWCSVGSLCACGAPRSLSRGLYSGRPRFFPEPGVCGAQCRGVSGHCRTCVALEQRLLRAAECAFARRAALWQGRPRAPALGPALCVPRSAGPGDAPGPGAPWTQNGGWAGARNAWQHRAS